jgi:hypothetical protein
MKTIKELMDALKQYDLDAKIMIDGGDTAIEIEEVTLGENRHGDQFVVIVPIYIPKHPLL